MAEILIIDDDEMMRLTLRNMLDRAGHSVREAADGYEGEAMWREHRPDLVITDLLMPAREGLETIKALRQEDKSIPIIAISGGGRFGNADYLAIAQTFGASAALRKPFKYRQLIGAVDSLLATGAGVATGTAA